jgi:hypothetical protein
VYDAHQRQSFAELEPEQVEKEEKKLAEQELAEQEMAEQEPVAAMDSSPRQQTYRVEEMACELLVVAVLVARESAGMAGESTTKVHHQAGSSQLDRGVAPLLFPVSLVGTPFQARAGYTTQY